MKSTVNKVILIGNLGDNPKVTTFENGNKIANFSIATADGYINKDGKKVEQTDWHNITARYKIADICEKYLKKGDKVYLEGKLKTRSWTDDTNVTKYITEIILDSIEFLTPKTQSPTNQSPKDNVPF